jgi:hypothetical protein
MSATEPLDESTQPHPRHRRDGVPFDGAPDLGIFASSRLDTNSADPTAHTVSDPLGASESTPLAEPESVDLDLTEFGEDPDTELAG